MTIDWKALQAAAVQVRAHAYAPYSQFLVGAALLSDDGRIFTGCNVENVSYGLTICAERNALFNAVANGARSFRGIAIVSSAAQAITPCGACRQVLGEFRPSFEVRCYGQNGAERQYTTDVLLPDAFDDSALPQKP